MMYGVAYVFDEFKQLYVIVMCVLAIGTTILSRPSPLWYIPFLLEHLFVGNNPLIFLV